MVPHHHGETVNFSFLSWKQLWIKINKPRQLIKIRDIPLLVKVHLVKAMVFPVVMYACESWTIKKAECQRIYSFELWRWRRLLRILWTARRSNQSILKEINLQYSLEGLMLKLQYLGHLLQRADSLEKTLMLGKTEGRRRVWQEGEMVGWHHWLNGHEVGQTPGGNEGQGSLVCCSLWGHKELDTAEQLTKTTTILWLFYGYISRKMYHWQNDTYASMIQNLGAVGKHTHVWQFLR